MNDEFIAGVIFALAIAILAVKLKRMNDDIRWCKNRLEYHAAFEHDAKDKETAKP